MKTLPVSQALLRLARIRDGLRMVVTRDYEPRAKDCGTCEVRGACCTDEHFVNVRVTRLETEAIRRAIESFPAPVRSRVAKRAAKAAEKLGNSGGSFSCPLYEKESGCLVHKTAKPLPCIHHACYERREDLPPDSLLEEAEKQVVRLNSLVYGNAWNSDPIPIAITRFVL
ncbi:MAG: hypothetical protein IPM63_11425 [Acidobacteriota bacterium]|nr:MAG: hypothetical protein IPM63_11425 [Acidobacteriota bacterium]